MATRSPARGNLAVARETASGVGVGVGEKNESKRSEKKEVLVGGAGEGEGSGEIPGTGDDGGDNVGEANGDGVIAGDGEGPITEFEAKVITAAGVSWFVDLTEFVWAKTSTC